MIESIAACRRLDRASVQRWIGIALADDGGSKIALRVQNHSSSPNPRLAGKLVVLSRFAPDREPLHPLSSLFAKSDAAVQHSACARRGSKADDRNAKQSQTAGTMMRDAKMKRAGGRPPALFSSLKEKD